MFKNKVAVITGGSLLFHFFLDPQTYKYSDLVSVFFALRQSFSVLVQMAHEELFLLSPEKSFRPNCPM